MPAKLLEFHGFGLNKEGITYFLMTDNKPNVFTCEIELDSADDPNHRLIGIIFGAQQSLVARGVQAARFIL